MNPGPQALGTRPGKGPGRPFVQPLAVAVVCAVLVCLVLAVGLVNLRNLDRTLVGYMEQRGLDVIEEVSLRAETYFGTLVGVARDSAGAMDPFFGDEDYSLHEALIMDLVSLSREVDFLEEDGPPDTARLAALALEERLRVIALVDVRGEVTAAAGPVPGSMAACARSVARGPERVRLDIFERLPGAGRIGSVCVRRASGHGAVVLGLDDRGFAFRSGRVSLRRAVEEVALRTGASYFTVTDSRSRIIGQAGEVPDGAVPAPEGVSSRKRDQGDVKLLEVTAPIRVGEAALMNARVGLSRDGAEKVLDRNRRAVFLTLSFMVAIAVLSMWLLYGTQNRHLARLNDMERRLQQAERLSALGRLAAGVAHEIRNPLNAISMATQRLTADRLDGLKGVIRDEIRRLNGIIEEFLSFSRTRSLEFRRRDLMELLRHFALLMEEESSSGGIVFRADLSSDPLMVSMDGDKLTQALFNITRNAMESICGPGRVELSAGRIDGARVRVRITDTGKGIPSGAVERLFDPDYTTKEKGLGLGLPIAYEIVRGHGGEIRVSSRPGEGSVFDILLPLDEGGGRSD